MSPSKNGTSVSIDEARTEGDDDDEEEDQEYVRIVIEPETKRSSSSIPDDVDHDPIPPLLTEGEMRQIALKVLPPSIMLNRWKRLYSLARDGDSFDAFLRLTAKANKCLLVIRTSRGAVFGAYSDSPLEGRHHHQASATFYGSAQACLWTLRDGGGDGKGDKGKGDNKLITHLQMHSAG